MTDIDVQDKGWFEEQLRRNPNDGVLWCQYGDLLWETECDPAQCVKAYEAAARLLPAKDMRVRLGSALVKKGDREEGLRLICESVEERPRAYGYAMLANAYLACGMFAEAEVAGRQAIDCDPESADSHFVLAEALRKKPLQAIEAYREAIRISPEHQEAWEGLGSLLASTETTQAEGIQCLLRAVELDPQDVQARGYLANAFWRSGQTAEAERQYCKAKKADLQNWHVRKWYSEFLDDQGRSAEAERERSEASELRDGEQRDQTLKLN